MREVSIVPRGGGATGLTFTNAKREFLVEEEKRRLWRDRVSEGIRGIGINT